jgi:hypothetical protein
MAVSGLGSADEHQPLSVGSDARREVGNLRAATRGASVAHASTCIAADLPTFRVGPSTAFRSTVGLAALASPSFDHDDDRSVVGEMRSEGLVQFGSEIRRNYAVGRRPPTRRIAPAAKTSSTARLLTHPASSLLERS